MELEEHFAQPAVDLIELRAAFRQQKPSLKIADAFRQGRTGQTDVPGDDLSADKGHASRLVERADQPERRQRFTGHVSRAGQERGHAVGANGFGEEPHQVGRLHAAGEFHLEPRPGFQKRHHGFALRDPDIAVLPGQPQHSDPPGFDQHSRGEVSRRDAILADQRASLPDPKFPREGDGGRSRGGTGQRRGHGFDHSPDLSFRDDRLEFGMNPLRRNIRQQLVQLDRRGRKRHRKSRLGRQQSGQVGPAAQGEAIHVGGDVGQQNVVARHTGYDPQGAAQIGRPGQTFRDRPRAEEVRQLAKMKVSRFDPAFELERRPRSSRLLGSQRGRGFSTGDNAGHGHRRHPLLSGQGRSEVNVGARSAWRDRKRRIDGLELEPPGSVRAGIVEDGDGAVQQGRLADAQHVRQLLQREFIFGALGLRVGEDVPSAVLIPAQGHLGIFDQQTLADHLPAQQRDETEYHIHPSGGQQDMGRVAVMDDDLTELQPDSGKDDKLDVPDVDLASDVVLDLPEEKFFEIILTGQGAGEDHAEQYEDQQYKEQCAKTDPHSSSGWVHQGSTYQSSSYRIDGGKSTDRSISAGAGVSRELRAFAGRWSTERL